MQNQKETLDKVSIHLCQINNVDYDSRWRPLMGAAQSSIKKMKSQNITHENVYWNPSRVQYA